MIDWDDRIPPAILNEIEEIRDSSKRNNKEESIAVCTLNNKYYIGGSEVGEKYSTPASECLSKTGSGERVGDVHTHPVHDENWGGSILPSTADLTGYIDESFEEDKRQIGCITNHYAPYIQCVQPKAVPDRKKKNEYDRAYKRQSKERRHKKYESLDDPYFQQNVPKDFDIAFYNFSGTRVRNPEPKKIIKCALGKSNRRFRHEVRTLEKGAFCRVIQDYTVPDDDRVGQECREEVKTRKLFGGIVEY